MAFFQEVGFFAVLESMARLTKCNQVGILGFAPDTNRYFMMDMQLPIGITDALDCPSIIGIWHWVGVGGKRKAALLASKIIAFENP